MKRRDQRRGVDIAVSRHLEQIFERRRGIVIVLHVSITPSTQWRKISESSSVGRRPDGMATSIDASNDIMVLADQLSEIIRREDHDKSGDDVGVTTCEVRRRVIAINLDTLSTYGILTTS
jgi:hypothetical protein